MTAGNLLGAPAWRRIQMMKKHRLISILALLLAMQFLLMPMQAMAQGAAGSGEGAQEDLHGAYPRRPNGRRNAYRHP